MTPTECQRILVVDDNEAGRYAVGRVLRRAGFEVTEAGTGAEALQRALEDRPDLVLLDMRLPDIPGTEVCRRLKSKIASILVLQMSASAVDDGSRVAALEGGADGYLTSPFEPAVLVATVRSLLRLRVAEQALQEAALDWQATFDAIRDGVALVDSQGITRRSNVAVARLLGLQPQEVVGRSLDELIPPHTGDPPLVEVLESRRRTSSERVLGERSFTVTIDPMTDSVDKLRGGVAILCDITERKLLDQRLWHSQKLESIGLLAGGVAHDFNNLLMGILGNASLAMDSVKEPKKLRGLLQDVVRATQRAAELTRQLLAYAGKGRFVVAPLDLSSLIRDLMPLIHSSIPHQVRVILDLAQDLPDIDGDKTQIEQLVMNLIINAGEAIDEKGGTVLVTTGLRHFSAEDLGAFLTEHRNKGNYISLEVRDTGRGMDAETLQRIFDPFFSTKFLGRGLGLSAALGIVRGHQGAVKVRSFPAQGTVFEVILPASELTSMPPPPLCEPTAVTSGRGTMLVVDDEEILRNMLEQALTSAGYEVLLAENGAEALSVFARNLDRISLVLLDLVMPVMRGEEILPHLLMMKPGLPVIVSSGQDEEECMGKLQEPRVAGFLHKPYTPASLTAKIREVLKRYPASKKATLAQARH